MTTIITKNSQTASAVPAASSLSVGELAVNTADGKLYTEHTGGVVKEIIPSTVVDGGITTDKVADGAITSAKIADGTIVAGDIASNAVTTAKIADSNVTEAKIADGAVTTNKLSSTGVTAGTYTTATVTVDAKGRITSASSGSGGGVTSLNGQTGAITNTDLYAIGSYVCGRPGNTTNYNPNSTIAGSSLRTYPISVVMDNSGNDVYMPYFNFAIGAVYTTIGSGTWRCVSRAFSDGSTLTPGLWVRIS